MNIVMETDSIIASAQQKGEVQKFYSDGVQSFEIELSKVQPPQGKWYHAAFHTVTSVVGVGVLGLPYAMSNLGWTAGIILLIVACAVSFYTSYLLISMHESRGKRFNRYRDLGQAILGDKLGLWVIVPFQFIVLIGLDITYMVTAGESLWAVQREVCITREGDCSNLNLIEWILVFAALQLIISQLPDMHSLWWVSLMGAIMSICYSVIAFGGSVAAKQDEDRIIYKNQKKVNEKNKKEKGKKEEWKKRNI
eukprot:TRINITY_DN4421_c0_g1_i8.p2 TRINITY_DN4421_c0_g1~~TRINITY_DN4421_c0_g1_i8.p2  ORF type:complete len:251 (-),score=14.82 TRINITY_DN4421_c0_g1_i8:5-757(-)